jgi:hypothetical protein
MCNFVAHIEIYGDVCVIELHIYWCYVKRKKTDFASILNNNLIFKNGK